MTAGKSSIGGNPNTDPHGHGTALAGIAAAGVNNNAGIAGVSYASTNIMPVQVLQADGTGYDSDVIAGVIWAADSGSCGCHRVCIGQGRWIVAATGNAGSTAPSYPAGMANVIGVAATDENDNLASSSNTGSALVAGLAANGNTNDSIYNQVLGGAVTPVPTPGPEPTYVVGTAANITLSPTSGPVGTNVTGEVKGFIHGAIINITFNGSIVTIASG